MKKVLAIILAAGLALGAAGCGSNKSTGAEGGKEDKTIVIGVSPVPHKAIVEAAVPILEKEGYKVKIEEFTDYVLPNTALADKDLDANFFQHVPFLNKTVSEKGLKLTYTVKVHLEPLGFYSQKIKNFDDIKSGAEIAIPNDPTNGARALRLLESKGLIKLKEGELVSKMDITENPKNIKITELDAPQLPRVLGDVEGAVINTNFALEAGMDPIKDALIMEEKDSPYANVVAVREENKDSEKIKALSKALNSPEVKEFIEENYKGSILPSF